MGNPSFGNDGSGGGNGGERGNGDGTDGIFSAEKIQSIISNFQFPISNKNKN